MSSILFQKNNQLNGIEEGHGPQLRLIKEIPASLKPRAIEDAVFQFIDEIGFKRTDNYEEDIRGLYNQTIESIAVATFLGGTGEFWMAEEDGQVVGYVLASITRDIDNTFCYWINQAWVHPSYRGNPVVKKSWEKIRSRARQLMCQHIVILSFRNDEAYMRFLGHGVHKYATLLKEDLED